MIGNVSKAGTSPIIVIIGPTASGKSAVALDLAEEIGGEIICADSRTIYRQMDIGTAKPSAEEQGKVRHHIIDVVDPDQRFSAANFQQQAHDAIVDIAERGKVPIVVGGTGLYVDSLLFDFSFTGNADPTLRRRLETMSIDELQTEILERDLPIPQNENNPRHLMRTIERGGSTPRKSTLRPCTLVLGMQLDRDVLKERIYDRVQDMLSRGLEKEVAHLMRQYEWGAPGMMTIGYREWRSYFEGQAAADQIMLQIQRATWQYARRQVTWFRRSNVIQWADSPEQIIDSALEFLNKNAA